MVEAHYAVERSVPGFTFDKAAAGLALLATLGVGYLAIAINHFDAQMASVRASLENAASRYDNQASRIDTAFTSIADIKGSTSKTEAAVDNLKDKIDDIRSSLKGVRQDLDRIKEATHAEAAPTLAPMAWVSPTAAALVKSWTVTFSGAGLEDGKDFLIRWDGLINPSFCSLDQVTEPRIKALAWDMQLKPEEITVSGKPLSCFTWTQAHASPRPSPTLK